MFFSRKETLNCSLDLDSARSEPQVAPTELKLQKQVTIIPKPYVKVSYGTLTLTLTPLEI
jgi:hypothetical protein